MAKTVARYEIRVSGLLSESVRQAFEPMNVVERPAESVIVGQVIDQAQLQGLLALIQSLGLQVESLHKFPDEQPG